LSNILVAEAKNNAKSNTLGTDSKKDAKNAKKRTLIDDEDDDDDVLYVSTVPPPPHAGKPRILFDDDDDDEVEEDETKHEDDAKPSAKSDPDVNEAKPSVGATTHEVPEQTREQRSHNLERDGFVTTTFKQGPDSNTDVETQHVEDHNVNVQGDNQRDRAVWGTAKFVGPVTWFTCTIISIAGCFLVLFPIGLFAFLCPCDTKKVHRVDDRYYDQNDNYLGEGMKVEGVSFCLNPMFVLYLLSVI
jgi:hypothetical protein